MARKKQQWTITAVNEPDPQLFKEYFEDEIRMIAKSICKQEGINPNSITNIYFGNPEDDVDGKGYKIV